MRPDTQNILNMECIKKRIFNLPIKKSNNNIYKEDKLLNTILFTKNELNELNNKLPKPSYNEIN